MAVKPYTWIPWPVARSRMPEIWSGWSWDADHADRAMVNCLRRNKDLSRGEAHRLDDPLSKVPIRDVTARLLRVTSYGWAEYEHTTMSSGFPLGRFPTPPHRVTHEKTVRIDGAELAWEPFRDDLIQFEMPTGITPNADAGPSPDDRRGRARYRGLLAEWMAPQDLHLLQRMGPENIAATFRTYCESERPDVLRLLPKRPRSMVGTIQGIITGRISRVQSRNQDKGGEGR